MSFAACLRLSFSGFRVRSTAVFLGRLRRKCIRPQAVFLDYACEAPAFAAASQSCTASVSRIREGRGNVPAGGYLLCSFSPPRYLSSVRLSSALEPVWAYKLKLNHGDLKATQGDTGHAEIDMLTKVYAHILDADRKITAQRFEEAFYQPQDLPEQKDNISSFPDIAALIAQIQQYPELGKILSDVLAKQASTNENTENGNGNLSDSE